MADPLGIKQKQLQEQESRNNQIKDPFNDKIKFIEDVDKAHEEQKPATFKKKKHTLLEAKQRYINESVIEADESPKNMIKKL